MDEWDGFCPICPCCTEIGWEMENYDFLDEISFTSLNQLQKEEQDKQDKEDDYNGWEMK